jgi:hypothetical protein
VGGHQGGEIGDDRGKGGETAVGSKDLEEVGDDGRGTRGEGGDEFGTLADREGGVGCERVRRVEGWSVRLYGGVTYGVRRPSLQRAHDTLETRCLAPLLRALDRTPRHHRLTQRIGRLFVVLQLLLDRLQAGSDGFQLFLRLFDGGEVGRSGISSGERGDLDGDLRARRGVCRLGSVLVCCENGLCRCGVDVWTDLDGGGGRVTPGEERSGEGSHRFGYACVYVGRVGRVGRVMAYARLSILSGRQ